MSVGVGDDLTDFAHAVRSARRPEIIAAVREVYAALELEIAERRPRCDASGRCCHFEAYGHRLYVTTVEFATFVDELPSVLRKPLLPIAGACPLLDVDQCAVHPVRPFGCRIFFCDPSADEWMKDAYERHLARLKSIHEIHGVPYHYREWRVALKELGIGL